MKKSFHLDSWIKPATYLPAWPFTSTSKILSSWGRRLGISMQRQLWDRLCHQTWRSYAGWILTNSHRAGWPCSPKSSISLVLSKKCCIWWSVLSSLKSGNSGMIWRIIRNTTWKMTWRKLRMPFQRLSIQRSLLRCIRKYWRGGLCGRLDKLILSKILTLISSSSS